MPGSPSAPGDRSPPEPDCAVDCPPLRLGEEGCDECRGVRRAPAGRGVVANCGRVAGHRDLPHLVVHQVPDGLGDRPAHADIGPGEGRRGAAEVLGNWLPFWLTGATARSTQVLQPLPCAGTEN